MMTQKSVQAADAVHGRRGHRLHAAVIIFMLCAGLGWGVWLLFKAEHDVMLVSPKMWLDGRAGTALNEELRLPGQQGIMTWQSAWRYRFMGDLGGQVALGCPNWLFYRDGLRPPPGTPNVLPERIKLMRHWVSHMQAKGVATLIVAVPDKSRIQAEARCGLAVSDTLYQQLDHWQNALSAEGIPFVDLRASLARSPAPVFFRTDVHMNSNGAERAAQAIAQAALPLLGNKGPLRYRQEPVGNTEPRMGDLIVLAGLEHSTPPWRPELEMVATARLIPVRSGGLLDEAPPAQVLLAGSSNGLRSQFADYLGRELGQEVWNMSMDGGQFSGSLMDALSRSEQWPSSLRLVIWEFSELSLSLPLTADEQTLLRQLP